MTCDLIVEIPKADNTSKSVEFCIDRSMVAIDSNEKDTLLHLTANELQHLLTDAFIRGENYAKRDLPC